MSNPSDTYQKILRAVPDILRSISELYVQGRGSTAPGSSSKSASGSSAFSSSSSAGDELDSLTGVRPAFKPFIIGFIPPDVRVAFVPVNRSIDNSISVPSTPSTVDVQGTESLDTSGVRDASGLPDSFYRKLVEVAHNVRCRPSDLLLMLYMESGIKAGPDGNNHVDGDKSKPVQARGINQVTRRAMVSSGMNLDFWENNYNKLTAEQQLPYVEKFLKHSFRGPYENAAQVKLANFAPSKVKKAGDPKAVIYKKYEADGKTIDNRWTQNRGIKSGSLDPDGDITVNDMLIKLQKHSKSPGFLSQLARMESVVGHDVAVAKPAGSRSKTETISTASSSEDPSGNPNASVMMSGNIDSTDPEDTLSITGRNIVVSDKRQDAANKQLNELKNQIDSANKIPSLLMLINPSEFTRNYEHQVDYPKGRRGQITHMWLEKPLTISCKGVTAAQYAFGPTGGGLTHIHRLHSLSYANLMSLVMMYRNNGHLYTQAVTGDQHNWGIPVISMSVFIYYDSHIYIGSFDDFSVSDDAEKPFNLSYAWKFTSRYDFEVTEINDQVVAETTGVNFNSGVFPRKLSISKAVDEGSAVPSEEPGPDPTFYPTFLQSEAPTGVTSDTDATDIEQFIDTQLDLTPV